MKKFLAIVCMVTCIFGLTACGATTTYSDSELTKQTLAEQLATNVIAPYFADNFMDTDYAQKFLDNCTIEEAAYYVESDFSQVAAAVNFDKLAFDGQGVKSAVSSFSDAYKTMGKVVSYDTDNTTVTVNKNEITVSIPVVCENKTGTIDVIYSSKRFLSVESVSINSNLTTSEIGKKAGLNTLLGMGTVFVVLVLIMAIISCFKFFAVFEQKKADKKNAKSNAAPAAPVASAAPAVEENLADDLELVAVISAAIAASEGAASTDGFVVRSIRRAR